MFKQIQYAKSNNKLGSGIVGVLEPKNFGSISFYKLELIIKALVVEVIAVLFVVRSTNTKSYEIIIGSIIGAYFRYANAH